MEKTDAQNTDILDETIIRFGESKKLPSRPSYNSVYNWANNGREIKGTKDKVYLEWCYIGGTGATSQEAFRRFVDRLNGEEV